MKTMADAVRLDVALVQRGLTASRERAQELVTASMVTVNDRPVSKCSAKVTDADEIRVLGEVHPFVGRGGCKLDRAMEVFGVDVRDAVCIDVGASTGGFTDVLLKSGAAKVYAVDVGTGQLDESLCADPRVVNMEKTNARTLTADMFAPCPTVAVMDVSFISIRLILPCLFDLLGKEGKVISLIKPQFEAGPQAVGKNGIVKQPSEHRKVLQAIRDAVEACGWRMAAVTCSPITGTKGNHEFLGLFLPQGDTAIARVTDDEIRSVVEAAKKIQ